MSSLTRIPLAFLLVSLLQGCANPRATTHSAATPTQPPTRVTGVVFCADGAGGYGATTEALRITLQEAGSGLYVELVDWSHGKHRMLADHLHSRNIDHQAKRLTQRMKQWDEAAPGKPIYLVGHSAGCSVVLQAAAEHGPSSVERIVLMAPSVASDFDLRPGLAASREGIDAFVSPRDWFVLGLGVMFFGTTDGRWKPAAGRVGFKERPGDAELYRKLRQHVWEPKQSQHGHAGGHYGSFEEHYLRREVLPLFGVQSPNATPDTRGQDR